MPGDEPIVVVSSRTPVEVIRQERAERAERLERAERD